MLHFKNKYIFVVNFRKKRKEKQQENLDMKGIT